MATTFNKTRARTPLDLFKAELAEIDHHDATDLGKAAAANARVASRADRKAKLQTTIQTLEELEGATVDRAAQRPANIESGKVRRGLWAEIIPEIINEVGKPLTMGVIKEMARKYSEVSDAGVSDAAIEQGVAKLVGKALIKEGGAYTTANLRAKRSVERSTPMFPLDPKAGPMMVGISRLGGLQNGMTKRQIIDALHADPALQDHLEPGNKNIYNALLALLRSGKLTLGEDGVYRLSPKQIEPPKAKANGGSIPGHVNGSNPSHGPNPARAAH